MSDRTAEDLRTAMREIAYELHCIDTKDCTRSEHNIASILMKYGFMKLLDRGDEVSGWTEYVRT